MLVKYRKLAASGLIVLDRKTVANLLGVSYASTNPILDRLVKAGILTRLKRDRYVLTDVLLRNTRKIANELVKPSAVSLWTALSDAGATTQVPTIVQSVTTKRSALIDRDGVPTYQYYRLPEKLYFGNALLGGIWTARTEKALLDLLYVQKGKIDWESIDRTSFDERILQRYAQSFPVWTRMSLALVFPSIDE